MLKRLLAGFDEWLLPRAATCAVCGDVRRASDTDCLCDACRQKLSALHVPPEACEKCLSIIPRGGKCPLCGGPLMRHIDKVYAPFFYHDAVAKIIQDFKFEACDDVLPLLCESMAKSLKVRDFDGLAPVPLHAARQLERGVNQAMLLAKGVGERTGIPVVDPLRRVRRTRPQTTLNGQQRRKNVRGAFVCVEDMTGKNILLIDDVRTVGATSAACARALREKGAKGVSLLVAAVVLHPSGGKKT